MAPSSMSLKRRSIAAAATAASPQLDHRAQPKTIEWRRRAATPDVFRLSCRRSHEGCVNNYRAAADARPQGHVGSPRARPNVIVADSMKEARQIAQPALNHVFGLFLEAAVEGPDDAA